MKTKGTKKSTNLKRIKDEKTEMWCVPKIITSFFIPIFLVKMYIEK